LKPLLHSVPILWSPRVAALLNRHFKNFRGAERRQIRGAADKNSRLSLLCDLKIPF
jgi:hypothetical protein